MSTNRIEMQLRMAPVDPIQVEGTPVGSVTRELALGQDEIGTQKVNYAGAKNQIVIDKRLSKEGVQGSLLDLAREKVKQVKTILANRSQRAVVQLAAWEKELKIVDDDETANDVNLKIYQWTAFRAMSKEERYRIANEAFANGTPGIIRAVLDWEESMMEPIALAPTVEEWIQIYTNKRNPQIANEHATLKADIDRFRFTAEQAILEISNDSGLADADGGLKGRMEEANALILESEKRRTESHDDQLSQKNARSPHASATAVA